MNDESKKEFFIPGWHVERIRLIEYEISKIIDILDKMNEKIKKLQQNEELEEEFKW